MTGDSTEKLLRDLLAEVRGLRKQLRGTGPAAPAVDQAAAARHPSSRPARDVLAELDRRTFEED